MKYVFIILLAFLFFIGSCSKDLNRREVTFEFTSDVSATYKFDYFDDDKNIIEDYTGTNWSKIVTRKKKEGIGTNLIRFVVYAPASWANTNQQANVTIKIIVHGRDGNEKVVQEVITGNWPVMVFSSL